MRLCACACACACEYMTCACVVGGVSEIVCGMCM